MSGTESHINETRLFCYDIHNSYRNETNISNEYHDVNVLGSAFFLKKKSAYLFWISSQFNVELESASKRPGLKIIQNEE